MDLSIIIAYHNEGAEFISALLVMISETIDIPDYEVIVVDDGSDRELSLPQIPKVKILRSHVNKGVGSAFDLGVSHAISDNLILMGCDVRLTRNNWASMLLEEIRSHPRSVTCTSCVRLTKINNNFVKTVQIGEVENGATISMIKYPHKQVYQAVLTAEWLPRLKHRNVDSYNIPCVLGACYGISKDWYRYIDGFAGHKYWGALEPLISLKSWLFSGSCRVAPKIYTGHIFKPGSGHSIPRFIIVYNKMFIIRTLFDDPERAITLLGGNNKITAAKELVNSNIEFITEKRNAYSEKKVISERDYFGTFGIKNPLY